MDLLKTMDNAGGGLIAAIRSAQDLLARVVESVVSPIARLVPELPLPEAIRPRPRAVAESAFRFWEELTRAQKDFTFRLLDAVNPTATRNRRGRHRKAA